jgi:hypothetical protein
VCKNQIKNVLPDFDFQQIMDECVTDASFVESAASFFAQRVTVPKDMSSNSNHAETASARRNSAR